jgi:hypothetical protein
MIGDSGAYASVGGKVLERAAGPRVRALQGAARRRRGPRGLHQQRALRRHARLRRQPGGLRHGGHAGPYRRAPGKDRWQMRWRTRSTWATPSPPARCSRPRSASRRRSRPSSRTTTRRWPPVRPSASAAASRTPASATACPSTASAASWWRAGTDRAVQRLHRDGSGPVHGLVQFASEVTGLPPQLFAPKVDTTFALQCGQTTGSRATLFSGNAAIQAATRLRSRSTRRARPGWTRWWGRSSRASARSTTPRRWARRWRRSRRTPRSRTPRSWWCSTRTASWSACTRRTTWAAPSTRCCARPGRGLGAHGPGLRAVRGLRVRRARLAGGPHDARHRRDARAPRRPSR